MLNSTVMQEMQRAASLGQQSEGLIVSREKVTILTERTPLLMGYWSFTFELHKAIVCLISAELSGAAFALLRPIIESAARAHVCLMCSDDVLEQLRDDSYRINLATVGKEIDAYFGMATLMQNFLKEARPMLHSFTHAGLLHLNRRFTGNDLAPNYSAEELIALIRTASSALFMVNNVVTKHLGYEQEWKRNNHLFTEWAQRNGQ